MPGNILCATDFSPSAEPAFLAALDYARRLGARLHLLHVRAAVDGGGAAELEQLAARIGAGIEVVTKLDAGLAAERIVEYARAAGVDLIVLGSHGHTGFSRALLGSVSERVMRTAPCPVLTVPADYVPAQPRRPAAPAEAWRERARCLVCAAPTRDLICESCRALIRGEAIDLKRAAERDGS